MGYMPNQPLQENPLELSLNQRFEKERFARAISESSNVKDLQKIAHVLLDGWFTQRAATQWIMRQAMAAPTQSVTTQSIDQLLSNDK